jgi:hypothetical protein
MNDDASQAFAGMTGLGAKSQAKNSNWPPANPAVLTKVRRPAPVLTDEMLPAGWERWIRDTAETANSAVGYIALELFVLAASAIGNSRFAIVKPGWVEASALFGMKIGDPSTRKSASRRPFLETVARIERQYTKDWKHDVQRLESEHAASGEKPKTFRKPPMPRWSINDATIEVVAEKSAENPRGLYVTFDELSAWYGSFGRYGSSAQLDRSFFLTSYDASYFVRDRMKNPNKDPIVIPRLNLSVIGAVVEDKLEYMFHVDPDDGLTSRFLCDWSEPPPLRSLLVECASDATAGERLNDLEKAMGRLRQLEFDLDYAQRETPRGLRLAEDAKVEFDKAYLRIGGETRLARGRYASWLGKAAGRIVRLALTYEYLNWVTSNVDLIWEETSPKPEPTQISLDSIRRAVAYTEYSTEMFRRALSGGDAGQTLDDAADLANYLKVNDIKSFGPTVIGRKAGFTYLRGETKAAKELKDNVLRILEDFGFIREAEFDSKRGTVKKYAVNPNLF